MSNRGRKWLKILCISLLAFFLVILIYLMAGGTQPADVYTTYNDLVEQNSGQGTVDKKLMFVAAYVKVTGDVTIAQRLGYDQQTIEEVLNPIDPDEPQDPTLPQDDSVTIDGFPNGLTITANSSTNFGYSDVRGLAALISQHYYIGNGNSFNGTYSHPGVDTRRDNINHGNFPPSYHVNISGTSDVNILCTVTYGSNTTQARQDCSGSSTALHRLLGFNCPDCGTSTMKDTLTRVGYTVIGDGNLSCSLLQVGDLIVRPYHHVEMVAYIDSTTVYSAGWGSDGNIEKIYNTGYNSTASINGKASDLNSGASIVLRCR